MKEALKLALYALKLGDTVFYPQTSIAIAAIEAALAQPAQEPVAWLDEEKKIIYWHNTHETDDYHGFKRTTPLYTTPQPAPLPYMHSQWQETIAGIPVTFESEADAKRFLAAQPAHVISEKEQLKQWIATTNYYRAKREYEPDAAQPAQEPWYMKMNGCKTKCEDCPDEPAQEKT